MKSRNQRILYIEKTGKLRASVSAWAGGCIHGIGEPGHRILDSFSEASPHDARILGSPDGAGSSRRLTPPAICLGGSPHGAGSSRGRSSRGDLCWKGLRSPIPWLRLCRVAKNGRITRRGFCMHGPPGRRLGGAFPRWDWSTARMSRRVLFLPVRCDWGPSKTSQIVPFFPSIFACFLQLLVASWRLAVASFRFFSFRFSVFSCRRWVVGGWVETAKRTATFNLPRRLSRCNYVDCSEMAGEPVSNTAIYCNRLQSAAVFTAGWIEGLDHAAPTAGISGKARCQQPLDPRRPARSGRRHRGGTGCLDLDCCSCCEHVNQAHVLAQGILHGGQ
jgi:hypothetical protein